MINKKSMKLVILGIISTSVISLGIGATAVSALTNQEKAAKLAELTNKSVEEVIEEKYTSNKTYGEIAEENGVLDQFQEQNTNCDGTGNGIHSNSHDPAHYHRHGNGQGHGQGYGRDGRYHRQ